MTLYPNHPDVEKREMLRIDGIIGTVRFRVAKRSLEIHISSFNVGLGRTTFKLDISGQEYS